jgi:3-oxoacid CoA-transferase
MAKSGCDVLIAIGGGSPIDSAKAIAYNIHEETGKWIPTIAVPTTLSVAETTQNAGFTTEEKHKIAVSNPELVPKGDYWSVPEAGTWRLTETSCRIRW